MLQRKSLLIGLRRNARLDYETRECLRIVLLDEMSAVQRRVLPVLRSGNLSDEATVCTARDRAAVAEAGHERFVPAPVHLKGTAIGSGLRVLEPNWNEGRIDPCRRLVAVIGKRRVIRGAFVFTQPSFGAALHDAPDWKPGAQTRE